MNRPADAAQPIVRYTPGTKYVGAGESVGAMIVDPDGDYVRFADHAAELRELRDLASRFRESHQSAWKCGQFARPYLEAGQPVPSYANDRCALCDAAQRLTSAT